MLKKANMHKGNFGIGSATREQADALGKAWVGEGYKVSNYKLTSYILWLLLRWLLHLS